MTRRRSQLEVRMDEQEVLEVGRMIRPHLPELVGTDAAEELVVRLDRLLDRAAAGEDLQLEVLDLLAEHPATREWARRQLYAHPQRRHYKPLPLRAQLTSAPRYACPFGGHFVWYQHSRADRVPLCGQHKVPLEPAP